MMPGDPNNVNTVTLFPVPTATASPAPRTCSAPGRGHPAEVRDELRRQMGDDVPRPPRPPDHPDVSALRERLGLA